MQNASAIRPLNGQDLLEIWKRRKWMALGIAVAISACTCIGVALWPGIYKGTALILIEQPTVSQDATAHSSSSDVEQQIAGLVQEVLSRSALQRLPIFNQVPKISEDELDQLLTNLNVEVLRENSDPRRPAGKPYGLKATFSSHIPRIAEDGANQLAELIVQHGDEMLLRQAKDTDAALRVQLDLATARVREKSEALADFRKQYSGQLPIEEQLTIDTLARLQEQYQSNAQAIERAKQTISDLQQSATDTSTQDSSKSAHEDPSVARLQGDLQGLQAKLADLQSRYKPRHPDVIKTLEEIDRLKAQIALQARNANTTAKDATSVPASSESRIKDSQAELAVRMKEQTQIEKQIAHYQSNLSAIPLRAQQFTELQREYESANKEYETLRDEVSEADRSTDIYQQHKGIHFHIQDYAALPAAPESPVRWKINLGGLGAGIFLALLIPGFLEIRDTSIKCDRDVEFYLGTKNLGLLPELPSPTDTQNKAKKKFWGIALSASLAVLLAAANVYLYVVR
jgi:succinoglycan biosynthesis transport protein ExoP